jgi:hypothetical protein
VSIPAVHKENPAHISGMPLRSFLHFASRRMDQNWRHPRRKWKTRTLIHGNKVM